MKILMVNKFLYPNGGSETYVFELGKQLEHMGHEVQYFGMSDERNIVGNRVESYTSNMDFHGNYLAKLLYPFKIIYSREARKKIKAVMEDFHPDVVHLNNFNFQLTPSIIYEIKKNNIPIVFTAHDYQLVCPNHMCLDVLRGQTCKACIEKGFGQCAKKKCIHGSRVKSLLGTIEGQLYKLLGTYRAIDRIICPSEFMKKMLDQRSELRTKTVVFRNFLSSSNKDINISQNDIAEKYVLYFGRYEKEKGVSTLINACKKLPEVRFKFAGRGPLNEEIDQLTNAYNYGFIEKDELQTIIKGAAFTICPSEWYENGPFSVMESIENGTPVIGANIGGIPELIRDGTDGLLFESGNIDDLVAKIKELWADHDKQAVYRNNCKSSLFDSEKEYAEKVLLLYSM